MVLLMAMKEGGAGIVGSELDIRLRLRIHQNDIFDDAAADSPAGVGADSRGGAGAGAASGAQWRAEAAKLETVAVQMKWMIIETLVDELQAVTPAPFERNRTGVGI